MIVVVIAIIVCILYKVYMSNKINHKRITQLEEMLDRYYKDREQRLNNMHKNK
jgi:uncharacterized membrane protein (DUF106 family)